MLVLSSGSCSPRLLLSHHGFLLLLNGVHISHGPRHPQQLLSAHVQSLVQPHRRGLRPGGADHLLDRSGRVQPYPLRLLRWKWSSDRQRCRSRLIFPGCPVLKTICVVLIWVFVSSPPFFNINLIYIHALIYSGSWGINCDLWCIGPHFHFYINRAKIVIYKKQRLPTKPFSCPFVDS